MSTCTVANAASSGGQADSPLEPQHVFDDAEQLAHLPPATFRGNSTAGAAAEYSLPPLRRRRDDSGQELLQTAPVQFTRDFQSPSVQALHDIAWARPIPSAPENTTTRKRRATASQAKASVTQEDLRNLFGLSIAEAATRIGVRTANPRSLLHVMQFDLPPSVGSDDVNVLPTNAHCFAGWPHTVQADLPTGRHW